MTIHDEHPFLDPEPDPVRRFRGRLGGRVSLWTSGEGSGRAGLTVSSLMVAAGEPAHVLGLVDPDSDLAAVLQGTGRAVVHLLDWRDRELAETFAGLMPAPGGAFRQGTWSQTSWGPLLDGVSLETVTGVGWSLLVDGVLDELHVGAESDPLMHRRGRYEQPS